MALPYKWQWRLERWKNALRGAFGGGEQQPRPKLCPACGALVGISAKRCHECGTSLRFSLAAISKHFGGLIGGPTPVSTVLLVANILMFGVSIVRTMSAGGGGGLSLLWGMNGQELYRLGASYGPAIFYGHEWYRLVTAMFLHGGLIHIGFNMMAFIEFGPALEELYGSARFLFLYTVTGAFGFVLSALLGHFSVGASGALLGLIGAILAVTTRRGGAYMRELRSRLIGSIVTLFALGFLMTGIDNAAHVGGLIAGFALGKLFVDREPINVGERRRAYALGWLAGIVMVASFVLMFLHFNNSIAP